MPPSDSALRQRFAGKVALVSGAGSGIGQGIAVELAREGADVVINDLPPKEEATESEAGAEGAAAEAVADGAQTTAERVRALGRRALVHYADVSDRGAVEKMVTATVAAFGQLDVVVPCAYFSHRAPFLDIDAALLQKTFDVTWVNRTLRAYLHADTSRLFPHNDQRTRG